MEVLIIQLHLAGLVIICCLGLAFMPLSMLLTLAVETIQKKFKKIKF